MAKIYGALIIAGTVFFVNEYFNMEIFTSFTCAGDFIAFGDY
jgi:hypothetical protein